MAGTRQNWRLGRGRLLLLEKKRDAARPVGMLMAIVRDAVMRALLAGGRGGGSERFFSGSAITQGSVRPCRGGWTSGPPLTTRPRKRAVMVTSDSTLAQAPERSIRASDGRQAVLCCCFAGGWPATVQLRPTREFVACKLRCHTGHWQHADAPQLIHVNHPARGTTTRW